MRLSKCNIIKARLKQLGVTQRELAEAIGYSHAHVSDVLNGAPSKICIRAIEEQILKWEAEDKKTDKLRKR